jgi:aspartate aminotransferase
MRRTFERRRDRIVQGLNAIDGMRCRTPEGAFYAFPDVSALLGKKAGDKVLETDLDLATFLLEEARSAVVPGTAFGAPGFLRVSYACSEEQIDEGLRRIGEAVATLA